MNSKHLLAAILSALLLLASESAYATTVSYTCAHTSSDHLQANLNGTGTWNDNGSGSPGTHTPVAGDTIKLSGLCQGDIFVTTSNLSFLAANGDCFGADGVDGMFELAGVTGVILTCLTAEGVNSVLNPTHQSNQSVYLEVGAIVIHDHSYVQLRNMSVGPSPVSGVVVRDNSTVQVTISFITGNGTGGYTNAYSSGVVAESGSVVTFGTYQGNDRATTISGNGTYAVGSCNGYDVLLTGGSSGHMYGATVGGNTSSTGGSCGEIVLQDGATLRARDLTLKRYGGEQGGGPAIQALGGSSVWIDLNLEASSSPTGSVLTAFADTSAQGLILAAGGSSVVLQHTSLGTPSATQPAIEIADNSSLVLAGANSIANTAAGGTAILIDHSSSLQQKAGPALGYPGDASETISGAGAVQMQSSIELGQGTASALTWTLSGSEIVDVQQNSALRLSGGVTVSGGGGVKIQQGSNAFFNVKNGGSNSATVTCTNSANNPMAHVSNPSSVSPAIATYNLNSVLSGIGGATNPGQANTCLNF